LFLIAKVRLGVQVNLAAYFSAVIVSLDLNLNRDGFSCFFRAVTGESGFASSPQT